MNQTKPDLRVVSPTVTQNDILSALANALRDRPEAEEGGQVGVTTRELMAATGKSMGWVLGKLRQAILAGQIERVRVVRRSVIDDRLCPTPGFRLK